MQLRALFTYLVFRHMLRTFNKKHDLRLTQVSVYILLSVHNCGKRTGATVKEIFDSLQLNCHTCSLTTINRHLNKFYELGWVSKVGGYPAKYTLTIGGINTLNDIED